MCTCVDFKTKDHYFGRNLDLEYRFNERIVITPKDYKFKLKNGTSIYTKYAMIGMATVEENYPLYAEASNEKGLSMAGLYFPGNACFFEKTPSACNLTSYELIPYFLGLYDTMDEIKAVLPELNITNVSFSPRLPVTDLHWMISDGHTCLVLEQMADGLKIYNNPVGILTNNPPFDYHLMNLHNYRNLSPQNTENLFSDKLDLTPYGRGMGAIGLPGDGSPASRFVRAAFHKLNSVCQKDEMSSVTQFFHILDSVALVQGSTITEDGKNDVTHYSCCTNTDKGIYYYKTYKNNQITAVRLTEESKTKQELSVFDLLEEQQIRYEN